MPITPEDRAAERDRVALAVFAYDLGLSPEELTGDPEFDPVADNQWGKYSMEAGKFLAMMDAITPATVAVIDLKDQNAELRLQVREAERQRDEALNKLSHAERQVATARETLEAIRPVLLETREYLMTDQGRMATFAAMAETLTAAVFGSNGKPEAGK